MKRIYAFGLFLTLLLGLGFHAKAYTVTLEWEKPGSIKIASPWGKYMDIPAGATSMVIETENNWDTIYILSQDGYLLNGATCDGDPLTVKTLYQSECVQLDKTFDGKTVVVQCSVPKRDDNVDIVVVNGANTITFTLFTGQTIPLQEGENTIPFNPETDNPVKLEIAGQVNAYSLKLNGQAYTKVEGEEGEEEKWIPEAIKKNSTMNADYLITLNADDELIIQPLAPGSQELKSCNLTIEYGKDMENCLSNIMDHSTGKMILPSDYEEGYITGLTNVIEGTELVLNFLSDDFTVSKVTLNGVNVPINTIDNTKQDATVIINDENSVLKIEGQGTIWNDITYTGYVSDPEGLLLGLSMEDYSLNYTEVGDVSGRTYGCLTMPEGSKEIQVTVSEKNNRGMGTFYFKPKEGYFIKVCYFGTPDDSETKGTRSVNAALAHSESTSFYMIIEKMEPVYTATLNVHASGYPDATYMKSSPEYSEQNDNPARESITLMPGESEVSFIPNYQNPFTIYLNQNQSAGIYLDGAAVSGSLNNDTNQTEYVLPLYAPASGETSDIHSAIDVYFTGSPVMANASLKLENGAKAEFFYSPVMHPANADGQSVIAGTVMTVKPTSSNSVVVYKGVAQELDANGEFKFTTSTTAADNTVTVTAPQKIKIAGTLPANGKTVHSLKAIKLLVPATANDAEIQMEPDEAKLAEMTITNASEEVAAKFAELGEPTMDEATGNYVFPVTLNTTLTEKGTYYISVPEGAFVQKEFDNTKNEYVNVPGGYITELYSGRVKVDPDAITPIENYTLSPESGVVEEISAIVLDFPQLTMEDVDFSNNVLPVGSFSNGTETIEAIVMPDMISGKSNLAFNIAPIDEDEEPIEITTPGKWTLTIQAGTIILKDGSKNDEITATYTIEATAPAYTISPEAGVVKNLSEIKVTFSGATSIAENEDVMITLVGTEYNANAIEVRTVGNVATISFKSPTTEGDYTLTIPAGAFTLDSDKGSEEIVAKYTLKSDWVLMPEPGTTVDSLNEFILAFPEATSVEFVGSQVSFQLGKMNDGYAAPGYTCVKDESASVPTFKLTLIETAQKPANGDYKFIISEGAFQIDGEASAEIYAEYTLEAPVSVEYTLDPNNGTILLSDWGIMFTVIFDETATVTAPNKSDIKITIDGTEVPSTSFDIMAEQNMLMFMITDDEYNKEGKLTLSIKAGAFKIENEDSPAIEGEWTVTAPKTFTVEISSANGVTEGNRISDLGKLYLYYPDATSVEIYNENGATLKDSNYKYNVTGKFEIVEPETRAAGVKVAVTFDPAPTEEGNYTLSVREGTLTIDSVFASPEIEEKYIFDIQTGIASIFADENGNVTVFTLDGKAVLNNVPAEQLRELEKGVYIINGKKVVVK
ncbi:MAG: hypothetical protein K2K81_01915 [Muribaculaceae bacterium]|nr:hypothetical protein [Muribaculaceae bacterium]